MIISWNMLLHSKPIVPTEKCQFKNFCIETEIYIWNDVKLLLLHWASIQFRARNFVLSMQDIYFQDNYLCSTKLD